jgi:hypothetical protein
MILDNGNLNKDIKENIEKELADKLKKYIRNKEKMSRLENDLNEIGVMPFKPKVEKPSSEDSSSDEDSYSDEEIRPHKRPKHSSSSVESDKDIQKGPGSGEESKSSLPIILYFSKFRLIIPFLQLFSFVFT